MNCENILMKFELEVLVRKEKMILFVLHLAWAEPNKKIRTSQNGSETLKNRLIESECDEITAGTGPEVGVCAAKMTMMMIWCTNRREKKFLI